MKNINKKIVKILNDILKVHKLNRDKFRIIAYQRAIYVINNLESQLTSGKEALKYDGIGKGISQKIDDIIKTGTTDEYKKVKKNPTIKAYKVFENIYDFGPKKIKDLINKKIYTIKKLQSANKKGTISLTKNQLIGIKYRKSLVKRIPRTEIDKVNRFLKKNLKQFKDIDSKFEIIISGSYRRGQKSSGDIDLLVFSSDMKKIKLADIITLLNQKKFLIEELSLGKTKYMGICKLNKKSIPRRIDIRYFKKDSYGAALLYFTGSKKFNKMIRQKALNNGLKLNEYGLFKHERDIFSKQYKNNRKTKKGLNKLWNSLNTKEKRKYINKSKKTKLNFNTERSILKKLGLTYVKPQNRNL